MPRADEPEQASLRETEGRSGRFFAKLESGMTPCQKGEHSSVDCHLHSLLFSLHFLIFQFLMSFLGEGGDEHVCCVWVATKHAQWAEAPCGRGATRIRELSCGCTFEKIGSLCPLKIENFRSIAHKFQSNAIPRSPSRQFRKECIDQVPKQQIAPRKCIRISHSRQTSFFSRFAISHWN